MKKFFKKLNIAHSPLFRIICVLCAVVTCVLPFAVSASAEELDRISIWDLPFTTRVDGDTKFVKVDFPLDSSTALVFKDGVVIDEVNGSSSLVDVSLESNSGYRVEFYPLGKDTVIDSRDIPSGSLFTITTHIDGSSINSWLVDSVIRTVAGYQVFDDQFNLVHSDFILGDGDINGYIGNPVNTSFYISIPANSYGLKVLAYPYFWTKPDVAPGNALNFILLSFSVEFPITELWLHATQNNKLNGVLDEVKSQLKEQGTTLNQVLKEQGITNDKLDDVLGEQEETNDKLDNIINGTVDSTLPPDSGVVEDFEKQEDEIMDSVNDGFNTALGVLEDTIVSIMEVLAGFHAISYIFNLFYGLPLIQLVVNFSLVLGLFGTMLGVANFVGNKFIGKVGGKGKD